MKQWVQTLRGALLLDTDAFARMRDRYDGVLRGLLIIVVVAWVAGLPNLLLEAARGLGGRSEAGDATLQIADFTRQLDRFQSGLSADQQQSAAAMLGQIRDQMQLGAQIATQIGTLPTIVPRPANDVLRALGVWLARPFAGGMTFPLARAILATWLGYGIWVMLAAKLLGGRGTLRGFFGSTSLYALPHVLNIFSVLPVLGPLLGFVAFAWGAAIYARAASVSHELSMERALLAMLMALLFLIVLFKLALFVLVAIIGIAVSIR